MNLLLKNKYIDTVVEKNGISGTPSCLELLVTELLRDKEKLVVLWLDHTSAYESVPHQLVEGSPKAPCSQLGELQQSQDEPPFLGP